MNKVYFFTFLIVSCTTAQIHSMTSPRELTPEQLLRFTIEHNKKLEDKVFILDNLLTNAFQQLKIYDDNNKRLTKENNLLKNDIEEVSEKFEKYLPWKKQKSDSDSEINEIKDDIEKALDSLEKHIKKSKEK